MSWSTVRRRRTWAEISAARKAFPEAAGSYAEAAASLGAYVTRADRMARDLERLAAPTIIVHGEEDRIVPAVLARSVARGSRTLALSVLADCGHLPHLEVPGRFLDAAPPQLLGAGDACIARNRGTCER